ncbi:ImmA/IrrE family metallo-endopeptidase [Periweissella cryptocerci]|uniref:ImmA/IrrE family metallo-endopeptidase n=1 Tax=Periweissella cryptocerci TaxID=2506420 RepID=A0A4P6YR97_9LACO|nr:XRE family transcriptional regulator [Periweissella cryptocerci]QBO35144.1 ImmA/IrrE family metallo-endopeptidase [Periweissella cryptocerci]
MFNGLKLKQVRELHNLTVEYLAEQLESNAKFFRNVEAGFMQPPIEIVNDLAEFFFVQPDFFYAASFLEDSVDEEAIFFDRDDWKLRTKTKAQLRRVQFVDAIINRAAAGLVFPKFTIDELRKYALNQYLLGTSIATIAETVREKLKIQQNYELLQALEIAGIRVLDYKTDTEIKPYSLWTDNGTAYIAFGNALYAQVDRNFVLAQQLGHLLLHQGIDMNTISAQDFRDLTHEAIEFAYELLLPTEEFVKTFNKAIKDPTHLVEYLPIREHFQVSVKNIQRRALILEMYEPDVAGKLMTELRREKWERREPGDDTDMIYLAGRNISILTGLFRMSPMTLAMFLKEFQIKLEFLQSLFGTKMEYLEDLENPAVKPDGKPKQTYMHLL